MMGRPIEIEIDAKTTGAERGVDQVGDSLENLGDRLDDVSDDAKKLDRDLTKALDDAADTAKRSSRTIGDSLGDNVKRGARDADEGLDTLNENAASNAKEIGASFDGTFEGLADGIQGFIAEATEGFGAVGLAAGVGVAAAIGIGMSALTEAAEKANALTEEAVELGDALATAGSTEAAITVLRDRFNEVANEIGDARSAWELWQPRAVTKAEQFADAIRLGALSAGDLEAAFNNPDPVQRLADLRDVAGQLQDAIDQANESNEEYGRSLNTRVGPAQQRVNREMLTNVEVSKAAKAVLDDEIATQEASNAIIEAKATALGLTVEAYREHVAETERATQAQESYASALEATADPVSTYEGILNRKEEADRAAAQATADATEDASDSWEDYTTNVAVSAQELIDEWNRQAAAAAAFETNLATIAAAGGQALADELRAKGPEIASSVAEVIATADPATQQAAIDAHARATGAAISNSMASGVTAQGGAVGGAVSGVVGGIKPPPIPMSFAIDRNKVAQDVTDTLRSIRPVLDVAAQVSAAFRRP
jgi:NTP pyrophosphatase (non-canonical NTP hydrolase)